MIKLVASDLDGTLLLNGAQSLPEELFPLIKKLKELGILIRHGSPKNGYWEVIDCGKKNNEDTE